jgi:GTP1/Obg family GTP-binding protein
MDAEAIGREPTERDHFPVDAAIGRYTRVVAEYVARVRAGDEHGAAKALARIEPARLAMITACEKFNARWGKADVRT